MQLRPLKTALILGSAFALTSALPAIAQDIGNELIIENFVGTLDIKTGDNLALDVSEATNDRRVDITRQDGRLLIDGGIEKPDGNDCQGSYGRYNLSWFNSKPKKGHLGGYKNLEDYPSLTISAPSDVALTIRNAIPFATVDDIGSVDIAIIACGNIKLSDISAPSRFDIFGSGDISAETIDDIDINIQGSGDVEIEDAARVSLNIRGSGDVDIDTATEAVLTMRGSGDVEFDRVETAEINTGGSGDIRIDTVQSALDLVGRGSGDFRADDVSGDVSIDMSGSGDVTIDDGDVSRLVVDVSGSSDVRFGGEAQEAELYARGSGDITVDTVIGTVKQRESGSADIRVSN